MNRLLVLTVIFSFGTSCFAMEQESKNNNCLIESLPAGAFPFTELPLDSQKLVVHHAYPKNLIKIDEHTTAYCDQKKNVITIKGAQPINAEILKLKDSLIWNCIIWDRTVKHVDLYSNKFTKVDTMGNLNIYQVQENGKFKKLESCSLRGYEGFCGFGPQNSLVHTVEGYDFFAFVKAMTQKEIDRFDCQKLRNACPKDLNSYPHVSEYYCYFPELENFAFFELFYLYKQHENFIRTFAYIAYNLNTKEFKYLGSFEKKIPYIAYNQDPTIVLKNHIRKVELKKNEDELINKAQRFLISKQKSIFGATTIIAQLKDTSLIADKYHTILRAQKTTGTNVFKQIHSYIKEEIKNEQLD